MSDISITLPDGSVRTLPEGSTGTDLAASIGPGLAKAALVVEVDGEPVDLSRPCPTAAVVRILTARTPTSLEHLRHSTAHVLAQAVLELWPGATFAGGPPIEDGFYYDFELPGGATFSDDDLERIDAKMREIIDADQPFERFELPLDDAKALMADHPYKRVFMDLAAAGDDADGEVDAAGERSASTATPPSSWTCAVGPHVPVHRPARPLQADPRRRRLLPRQREEPDAAAHLRHGVRQPRRTWRRTSTGWRRRPSATTASSAPSSTCSRFPDEIGSGLAVFHPKGGIIRRLMEDYSRTPPRGGGLRVRVLAAHHQVRPVRDVGPPRLVRRRHVPADGARPRPRRRGEARHVLPQADELPVPHPDLQDPAAVATASCRCGCSSSAPSTATRSPAWCTA